MNVEMVGGPDDGRVWAVEDGCSHLSFAMPTRPLIGPVASDDAIKPIDRLEVKVPIVRRKSDGMAVAVWRYRIEA